ncbi:serine/threonine protein kinase [Nonomuraea sp. NN258]|uniref:serine/threonine-protein kinase n=1 Tax=Nonomuraea antri TaxID=2730852 RepID=UPI001569302D|nr:serine/threonine-protein kinase [Nonomuraea antri]NRQ37375.1 serine/threonine protein kinase [Nonomuraea antri]
MRSIWQVIGAVIYSFLTGSFALAVFAYGSYEDIPEPLYGLVSLALIISWFGGAIHSGILVPAMARARSNTYAQPPPYQPAVPQFHHPNQHRRPGPYQRPDLHQRTTAPDHRPPPQPRPQPQPQPHPDLRQHPTSPTQHRSPGEPEWIGHYRVLQSVGRGGQGAVYLAMAPNGVRVAVKVLHDLVDETARTRFAREVEAARRVATFSTARVLDVSITGQQAYIVSEYVEGPSLERLVRQHGPRDEDSLTRLALSTAGALAAIHKAGIVHRDFKPSNVLIGPDGPRVIDFGIARALDQVTMTSGRMVGTPPYMSPEQLSGEAVGPASDVFSWAVTMVFAATGRPAFGEDSVPAVFHRVLTVHPDLSPLPPTLRQVVGNCLSKRPDERPSASDVMLAIVH